MEYDPIRGAWSGVPGGITGGLNNGLVPDGRMGIMPVPPPVNLAPFRDNPISPFQRSMSQYLPQSAGNNLPNATNPNPTTTPMGSTPNVTTNTPVVPPVPNVATTPTTGNPPVATPSVPAGWNATPRPPLGGSNTTPMWSNTGRPHWSSIFDNIWEWLSGNNGGGEEPPPEEEPETTPGGIGFRGSMTPWNVQFWNQPGLKAYFEALAASNPNFTVQDLVNQASQYATPSVGNLSYRYE